MATKRTSGPDGPHARRRKKHNARPFIGLPAYMGLLGSERLALEERAKTLRTLLQEADGALARLGAAQMGSRQEFFDALRTWGAARDRVMEEIAKPLGLDEAKWSQP